MSKIEEEAALLKGKIGMGEGYREERHGEKGGIEREKAFAPSTTTPIKFRELNPLPPIFNRGKGEGIFSSNSSPPKPLPQGEGLPSGELLISRPQFKN